MKNSLIAVLALGLGLGALTSCQDADKGGTTGPKNPPKNATTTKPTSKKQTDGTTGPKNSPTPKPKKETDGTTGPKNTPTATPTPKPDSSG
jgi:hypothetical protein